MFFADNWAFPHSDCVCEFGAIRSFFFAAISPPPQSCEMCILHSYIWWQIKEVGTNKMWKITTLTWLFWRKKNRFLLPFFHFACKNVDLPFFSPHTNSLVYRPCCSSDGWWWKTRHVSRFYSFMASRWGNGIYVYMLLKYKCSLRINFAISAVQPFADTHIY